VKFDPNEEALLTACLPPNAMPVAYVMCVYYLDPANSKPNHATVANIADIDALTAIGMLEIAKFDVMGDYNNGPFDPHHKQED